MPWQTLRGVTNQLKGDALLGQGIQKFSGESLLMFGILNYASAGQCRRCTKADGEKSGNGARPKATFLPATVQLRF